MRISVVILLSLSFFLSFSQKNTKNSEIVSKIDSVMEMSIVNQAFPGAVVLIGTRDSILYHKAYGYHTYDSLIPVQTYHLYDLASVTKVTAATLALMKLYEDSLLFLDDPISKYIDGFKFNKRGKATVRSTLAHQAGWRSWIPYYQEMLDKQGNYKSRFFSNSYSNKYPIQIHDSLYLTEKNYQYIKRQIKHSDFEPGKGYEYSGLFFYMVPELVERLTGKSLIEYLDSNFYVPIGSNALTFNPLEKFQDSLIVPTEIDTFFRQQAIHGKVHDEGAVLMGGISGNAGLFGNAESLFRIWQMLLNDGIYDSVRFLKPSTIDLFTTVQYPNEGNRRGLGFDKPLLDYDPEKSSVSEHASSYSFGHTGYTGPLVWADPKSDLIFIILCNRVYPSRLQRQIYTRNIRPTLHDLAYSLRINTE